MPDLQDYLLTGVFTRTHGVQGALVLRLQGFEPDDIPEMEWVFVTIDGLPVPFFVHEVRSIAADKAILSFEAVITEPRARELVGCPLWIAAKGRKGKATGKTGLPDIIGYTVVDQVHGEMGKVAERLAIAGNPLLRIVSGEKEWLIPAHKDIVLEISEKKKTIRIKAPEGLKEL